MSWHGAARKGAMRDHRDRKRREAQQWQARAEARRNAHRNGDCDSQCEVCEIEDAQEADDA